MLPEGPEILFVGLDAGLVVLVFLLCFGQQAFDGGITLVGEFDQIPALVPVALQPAPDDRFDRGDRLAHHVGVFLLDETHAIAHHGFTEVFLKADDAAALLQPRVMLYACEKRLLGRCRIHLVGPDAERFRGLATLFNDTFSHLSG